MIIIYIGKLMYHSLLQDFEKSSMLLCMFSFLRIKYLFQTCTKRVSIYLDCLNDTLYIF